MLRCITVLFISLLILPAGTGQQREQQHTIHIVQYSWHTGIVLETDEVPEAIFPEIAQYKKQTYIDISWGDERYYQHPNPGISIGAAAVLWPTSGVIRLDAFSMAPENYFRSARIMKIRLTEKRFHQLCRFVSTSFVRDKNEKIIPSTMFGESSMFFLSTQKYTLFRTCNTWVALALKDSGFDISSFFLVTANQLFRRLEKIEQAEYVQK